MIHVVDDGPLKQCVSDHDDMDHGTHHIDMPRGHIYGSCHYTIDVHRKLATEFLCLSSTRSIIVPLDAGKT